MDFSWAMIESTCAIASCDLRVPMLILSRPVDCIVVFEVAILNFESEPGRCQECFFVFRCKVNVVSISMEAVNFRCRVYRITSRNLHLFNSMSVYKNHTISQSCNFAKDLAHGRLASEAFLSIVGK